MPARGSDDVAGMPRARSQWGVVAALVAFGATGVARADADGGASDPYELTYSGAPGCPSETAVRDDVAARVHDAARATGARLELTAAGKAGRFSGTLLATSAAQERGGARSRERAAQR